MHWCLANTPVDHGRVFMAPMGARSSPRPGVKTTAGRAPGFVRLLSNSDFAARFMVTQGHSCISELARMLFAFKPEHPSQLGSTLCVASRVAPGSARRPRITRRTRGTQVKVHFPSCAPCTEHHALSPPRIEAWRYVRADNLPTARSSIHQTRPCPQTFPTCSSPPPTAPALRACWQPQCHHLPRTDPSRWTGPCRGSPHSRSP